MLFNSVAFAIFLPIVFFTYWKLSAKYQWIILLISSCYFYMSWNIKYITLIGLTTIVSFFCAILIEKKREHKKFYLILSLIICLGTLFFFKYFNFTSDIATRIFQTFAIPIHPTTLKVMLPVGISFYTFQTLSYVIDVYRGRTDAEHHFGKYAAFITFFPQLVAGPIERTNNLLPQIKAYHTFDYNKTVYGLKLMAWGFFKKLAIADNLAMHVDLIYNDIYNYSGLSLLVATVFFAFQIYCDFSGYSDIAIGTAHLFGIDLMTNFSSPYYSESLKEFWSRWHISLSTWFRDYVYIPLGGNRKGRTRTSINLIITFLLSGLWHGANWTFIVWGGAHGALQVIEKYLPKPKKNKPKRNWWRVSLTFVIVVICWTFFRAASIQEALYVFAHGFDGITHVLSYIINGYRDLQFKPVELIKIPFSLITLAIFDWMQLRSDVIHYSEKLSPLMRWILYIAGVMMIYLFANVGNNSFIYFQF